MKPKNFPARKLLRKLRAEQPDISVTEREQLLADARRIRTKKNRGSRATIR